MAKCANLRNFKCLIRVFLRHCHSFGGGFVIFSHFFLSVFKAFSDLLKNNSHLLLVISNCYIYLRITFNETDMKTQQTFTFQEDQNTIWFCTFLGFSKEWMIWAERNGELIWQTKEFKKRLSKDWKEAFKIK